MISKKEVQHIAKLARLSLSEQEIEKFQKEFSSILDYIEELNKADLSDLSQEESFVRDENVWREDEPNKNKKEKLLEMMPETKDGYLKVKKVL